MKPYHKGMIVRATRDCPWVVGVPVRMHDTGVVSHISPYRNADDEVIVCVRFFHTPDIEIYLLVRNLEPLG